MADLYKTFMETPIDMPHAIIISAAILAIVWFFVD